MLHSLLQIDPPGAVRSKKNKKLTMPFQADAKIVLYVFIIC